MPNAHCPTPAFPSTRLRRLRQAAWLRELVRETTLAPRDLILPLFVQEGENLRTPVSSLPGVARLSIDLAIEVAKEARAHGICAVALFPVIDAQLKTPRGEEALNPENLICRALRELKESVPGIGLIADVALDPFTSHGQDGILDANGNVDNDGTVELLCRQALVQAQAGCDMLAPSDMMDGRIQAIRRMLETEGLKETLLLAYSAKYASALYGPFRDAVGSSAALGKADKRSYQMDPANGAEALREAALDIAEGADMVMVKPALPYLDVIAKLSAAFPVPVLAYQVSGEYAMIHAGAAHSLDAVAVMHESLLSIKRAGARAILTYAALDMARRLTNRPVL